MPKPRRRGRSVADGRRSRRAIERQAGFTLVELLVAISIFLLVVGATEAILVSTTWTQTRDQAYAEEIASTQAGLARLVHDLRGATSLQVVGPDLLEFQLTQAGTTYNVMYDCSASDALGAPYTRCARTQAVAPSPAPVAGSTAGSEDIQHVWNNATNTANGSNFATFCNSSGSARSGSVFFASNPSTSNPDSSPPACDETYEVANVAPLPSYIQITVQVPASGDLKSFGLRHLTVLQTGTYLPNADSGA